jgi:hypothetical protein
MFGAFDGGLSEKYDCIFKEQLRKNQHLGIQERGIWRREAKDPGRAWSSDRGSYESGFEFRGLRLPDAAATTAQAGA